METLTLRPWSDDDLPMLRAANSAAMTAHLNGPESAQQVDERHARYLGLVDPAEARMLVIDDAEGQALGAIGYWAVEWRGEPAFETGWFVLPQAQGRGVASAALALLIDIAREHRGARRHLVAFPGVDNAASNGVCRRNGFQLVGSFEEQFRGADLAVNEWALDLGAADA
ncbi:GNAT family N-acetyltransferase [Microbacterium sp. NPDC089695]|uniref:GNAT family N-acetyltransferase n=1 Tax=Microbacterium sp. NPDC089695 TaxID=3364198 RepID=UPI00381CCE7C